MSTAWQQLSDLVFDWVLIAVEDFDVYEVDDASNHEYSLPDIEMYLDEVRDWLASGAAARAFADWRKEQ